MGSELTFALREALFALARIEDEPVPAAEWSRLPEVAKRRMLAEPAQWESYYPGSTDGQRLARRYSYSDRLRYYWPDPEIEAAQERLRNLSAVDIPLPLLSAYRPRVPGPATRPCARPHPCRRPAPPRDQAHHQLALDPAADRARTAEAAADRARRRFGDIAVVPGTLAPPNSRP